MELDQGRREFLRKCGVWVTGGALWLAGGCREEIGLLEFERRYKNKLLDPKEHSLRRDWVFHIARALSSKTRFDGSLEDLTANFLFAFSVDEYFKLVSTLPGYDPDDQKRVDFSNAVTIFTENGPSGTVISVGKIMRDLGNLGQGRLSRVVGIICAHEMGHRTAGKPKNLERHFHFPGSNRTMEVTSTQGLKWRGFDQNNPQQSLQFLGLLDEVPAELQARQTYGADYITVGSPTREAPTLLSRTERLFNSLGLQITIVTDYQRNNDPFGLIELLAEKGGYKGSDYFQKINFGVNTIMFALTNT